jgi:sec-independent protein translocase protein TatA
MFTGLESPTHLLILLAIILLLFGAKHVPELGRSMGRGIKEFKEGLNTEEEPEKTEGKDPEAIAEEKEKAEADQQTAQGEQRAASANG